MLLFFSVNVSTNAMITNINKINQICQGAVDWLLYISNAETSQIIKGVKMVIDAHFKFLLKGPYSKIKIQLLNLKVTLKLLL